ncbi:serine/threonine-protein kinase dst1-like [Trematomus bernacchii]|nr:serine/threonine-protein kinase dst1-like [Trematomus bernacchii]XP_033970148.1 serine/threonine-protein kinase dst1-like [Trematomus bernacchii]
MERYESLGLVGEGSYGTVLKCRHRESGRLVAIKKFVDSDDDKTVKKIALREIKLLRQLRHDNLVNLLEVWKRRRRWYLVFEFVERTLLDDLEQNPTGLDLNTSRQILFQILRAAAFCHQQNIIHRDIKPENILISQCGVVKMCDFGFARTMTSPAEGGVYTDYVATRWYRAPELLVGDTKYGKAVDVWAFGCLLLEMLTGQPLFPGDSDLDQIYHIVRCFGNLTAHHQELFYRNPGFSGVRLPEYSDRVPLDQRFPTIPPTALDLAQSCLQMDPERRAQCSELLEHPLFTQDSFHIRFLDELNAKIQKDHRENSTLPKITKTPRRERNEGDDRNRRSKEKKQTEDLDERGNKEKERKEDEKMEKTKGKQTSKVSKTIQNPSEPLISTKQSKTLGAKIDNVAKTSVPMKSKPGKVTVGDQRKEPEASKSTKTFTLDSLESTKTATDLKDNNTLVAKQGKVASLETDGGFSGLEIGRSIKSELNQDFGKNWTNTKVLKLSKTLTSDHTIGVYSPKASLKPTLDRTDTSLTQKMGKTSITEHPEGASTSKISNADQVETSWTLKSTQPSSNDHIKVATTTIPPVNKPCKTTSGNQNETSTTNKEQRKTSEVLPLNSKTSKTTSNSKMTKNNTFLCNPSKTLLSDISRESSTVFREATPVQSTLTTAKGTSKFLKTGSYSDAKPTRGLPTDRGLSEISAKTQQDVNEANNFEIYDASSGDYKENPESSEPSSVYQLRTPTSKTTAESRTTVAIEISESNAPLGTIIPKTLKVSDKENREDLALSVSISSTTTSVVDQIPKVEHSNYKSLIGEPKMKHGSFSNHSKSVATMTLKTQKITFPTEARKKRDIPETKDGSADADSTRFNSTTPDHKALTRSFVFNTPDVDEFNISKPQSSPPPPPPAPSSSPLIPSSPVVNPPTSDHFSMGSGFHPGNHSLRFADKSRHHGGVYGRLSNHMSGSLTAQVSDKSQTCERSLVSDRGITATKKKSDVHFPDLRSSGLPEIRGREGKLNKGTSKDQRKSEAQQHGHTSTDSQTP